MSNFDHLEHAVPVEIFAVAEAYKADPHPDKIDLGVGVYRDDEGKPYVLPVVRRIEMQVASDESLNHTYLPIVGSPEFTMTATKFLLGEDSPAILENRAFGIQSLSGTGALRIGAELLAKKMGITVFYVSNPTWENHRKIFFAAGFQTCNTYKYWSPEKRGVDMKALLSDLKRAPERSVIILQACSHNPTGYDPTHDDWKQIAKVVKHNKLIPFFDNPYQGFASGDPDSDAFAVRYFVEQGIELFGAQSFAKNFGLYGERIGNLTVVQKSAATTDAVRSQIALIIRGSYSNPPAFASRIVATILNDRQLRAEWLESTKLMSRRIVGMRQRLYDLLKEMKTPGDWSHIIQQVGIFCYTELNEKHIRILTEHFHVYLLKTGRISVSGLTEKNVAYFARAIHLTVTQTDTFT